MNKRVIENIIEVRGEADDMLDNLKVVRGERYMRLVKAFLLAANAMEVHGAAIQLGELDEPGRTILGDAMCKCIYGMVINMATAAGFSPDELSDATRDATAMDNSISGLMREAVRSGIDGDSFGEAG